MARSDIPIEELARMGVDAYRSGEKKSIIKVERQLARMFREERFREAVVFYERVLAEVTDQPLLYRNAATACQNLATILKAGFFEKKGEVLMDIGTWMFDEASPFEECVAMRDRAAEYLRKVIDLDENLSEQEIDDLFERIEDLEVR